MGDRLELQFQESHLGTQHVTIPWERVPWDLLWRAGLRQGAIAIIGFWQGRAVLRTVVYPNGHWQVQVERSLLDLPQGQEILELYQRYIAVIMAHLRRHLTQTLDAWLRPIAFGGWLVVAIACQSPIHDQPWALGLSLGTYGLFYWRPRWGRSPIGWGMALISAQNSLWTVLPYILLVFQKLLRRRVEAWLWQQAQFFMLLNI